MLQKLERLLAKDPDVLPEPIEVKLPFLEHDPNE